MTGIEADPDLVAQGGAQRGGVGFRADPVEGCQRQPHQLGAGRVQAVAVVGGQSEGDRAQVLVGGRVGQVRTQHRLRGLAALGPVRRLDQQRQRFANGVDVGALAHVPSQLSGAGHVADAVRQPGRDQPAAAQDGAGFWLSQADSQLREFGCGGQGAARFGLRHPGVDRRSRRGVGARLRRPDEVPGPLFGIGDRRGEPAIQASATLGAERVQRGRAEQRMRRSQMAVRVGDDAGRHGRVDRRLGPLDVRPQHPHHQCRRRPAQRRHHEQRLHHLGRQLRQPAGDQRGQGRRDRQVRLRFGRLSRLIRLTALSLGLDQLGRLSRLGRLGRLGPLRRPGVGQHSADLQRPERIAAGLLDHAGQHLRRQAHVMALGEQLADRGPVGRSERQRLHRAGRQDVVGGAGRDRFLDRARGPPRGQHPQRLITDAAQREAERVEGRQVQPRQVVHDEQRRSQPAQDGEQPRGDLARPGRHPRRRPPEGDVQRRPLRLRQPGEHLGPHRPQHLDQPAERALAAGRRAVHSERKEAMTVSQTEAGV